MIWSKKTLTDYFSLGARVTASGHSTVVERRIVYCYAFAVGEKSLCGDFCCYGTRKLPSIDGASAVTGQICVDKFWRDRNVGLPVAAGCASKLRVIVIPAYRSQISKSSLVEVPALI